MARKEACDIASRQGASLGGNGAKSRSWTIGSELVGSILQTDLYIIAFWLSIEFVSHQIERQILSIHAGIIK